MKNADTPIEINKPEISFGNNSYSYSWPDLGIQINVERLDDDGQAEVAVYSKSSKDSRLLTWSRTNLLSIMSCSQLAKRLNDNVELDWGTVLPYVSTLTLEQYRKGGPVVEIGRKPEDLKVRYQLEPLLERGQATTIYAAGGSGKSYLADYFAILIQLGYTGLNSDFFSLIPEQANVLYLDWEACEQDHQRRVWAIKQGIGIDTEETFFYRFCEQPLVNDIHNIQKLITEKEIGFVIIDSQMAASGYGPDAALQASQFYNALRSLHCTSLTIDHISKSDWAGGTGESTGPYGSVVKYNRARSVFELKKSQEPDNEFLELSLKHIKHNEGKLLKPIGVRINFNHGEGNNLESVTFTTCNLADNSTLAKTLPLKDRLIDALRRGTKEIDELSEELNADKGTIRARLNGNKTVFKHYQDGWGLLE
jgi:hypothetical protein